MKPIKYGKLYNIYFGTINTKIPVQYHYSKIFNSDEAANKVAKEEAKNFYYKYENKLVPYKKISEESKLTGISINDLYEEHIEDMCRWYAIPAEVDTIPESKLIW